MITTQSKQVSTPNAPIKLENAKFIYDLDKVTQDVVRQIMDAQTLAGYGVGGLVVHDSLTVTVKLPGSNGSTTADEQTSSSQTTTTTTTQDDAPATTGSGFKLMRTKITKKPNTTTASSAPASTAPTPVQKQAESTFSLTLASPVTVADLLVHRRSFTKMATLLSIKTTEETTKAFVDYLKPQVGPK